MFYPLVIKHGDVKSPMNGGGLELAKSPISMVHVPASHV